MIHTIGYRIRALESGRSQISICVFGAVHLLVEASLDGARRVNPPTVLVRRSTATAGGVEVDDTAEECDGECQDAIHSVRIVVELNGQVEDDVRAATRQLLSRLEAAKPGP